MELTTQDGLQDLYLSMRNELLRFLSARIGDGAQAEDIIQDVWVKLAVRTMRLWRTQCPTCSG